MKNQNYIFERFRGYIEFGMGILIMFRSIIEWDLIVLIIGIVLLMVGAWDLAKYSRIEEMKYGK